MPIAILIPALNPDEKLVRLVGELQKNSDLLFAIVDDGSASEYQRIFATLKDDYHCLVYAHPKNLGKGAAIKTGLRNLLHDYPGIEGVVTADCDGQHLSSDILAVAEAIKAHPNDLVLGTRDLKSKNVPFKSRWGNRITSLVFRMSANVRCSDTQTGLRGIPSRLIPMCLDIPGDRYEYEMNMLSAMAEDGIKFIPVSISTVYVNANKGSHFHAWRDSWRIYKHLLRNIFVYAACSLISSGVDIGGFWLLNHFFFDVTPTGILASTVIARCVSGIVNFFLNKVWCFRSPGKNLLKAAEYFVLFCLIMFLSWGLVTLFSYLPINITVIKIIVDAVLFIISYSVQKIVIFPKSAKKA